MRVQSYYFYLKPANFSMEIFSKCLFFCNFALNLLNKEFMIVKTRAIVLRSVKYGDSQLIVDLFTEELGRLAFLVRIPKSPKARIKRQYFQAMTIVDLEFDYRQRAKLQHLKEVSIGRPFSDIPFSPYKLSITMFLAEFLCYSTRNEQAHLALFQFLEKSMEWLDLARDDFANFHVVFMIRLSLFLGFSPNMDSGEDGDYFDLEEGRFVCNVPIHSHYLGKDDATRMRMLVRLTYSTMHLYSMSRVERNRCVSVIVEYYRLHIPDFPEMKTLSVLQDLFV